VNMNLNMKTEPALVLALVQAAIALLVSFGLELSSQQVGSIVAFTAAALAVFLRRHVSPVAPAPETTSAPATAES
jgi:hypothetical protein